MKRILLSLGLTVFAYFGTFSQNFYIQENFNTSSLPTGWTNTAVTGTNVWSFGLDGSVTDPGNNNIDGTAMAYFDDDAFGNGSNSDFVELVTPTFDNTGIPQTFLEFDYNLRTYSGINDSLVVDVFDGTSWNRVLSIGQDDCGRWTFQGCTNNFPRARIDISTFVSSSNRVRFQYKDGGSWAWYAGIDNVEIYSPLPTDMGVSEVLAPLSGCGFTNEPVEVKVKNFGFNSVSSFDLTFNINNGAQVVTESVTSSIAAGDSLNYTFTGLANLSAIGTYDIQAYATLTGDGAAFNDSVTTSIVSEPVYTLTYSEDFETPNHNWRVSGSRATWARGTPSSPFITSAAGGTNAFVTNLTGPYNTNELSYLTSPCLDFSASVVDPILSFNLIHRLGNGNFDVLWMESSIDNEVTWSRLPASSAFAPQNWYNDAVGQQWTRQSNGWESVENTLDGLAGESQVKLRFVFDSDGSTNLDGVGIDNIAIRDRQAKDFSLNSIAYPTASSSPLCGYGTESISIRYENKGSSNIDTIYFAYQVDNTPIRRDTSVGAVGPGQILNYTFQDPYDFSAVRSYQLRAWGFAPGDTFNINDSSSFSTINNVQTGSAFVLPYTQDFDQMQVGAPFSQGWTSNPQSTGSGIFHSWNVGTGGTFVGRQGTMTSTTDTGPNEDCSGSGNAAYLETSSTGTVPILESPCVILSPDTGIVLNFQYHMYGATMGSLITEVYDGIQWVAVDSINGQEQTNSFDPWRTQAVNLNAFAGRRIKIRFKGLRLPMSGAFQGDMALDCIRIIDLNNSAIELSNLRIDSSTCIEVGEAYLEFDLINNQRNPIHKDSLEFDVLLNGVLVFTDSLNTNLPANLNDTSIKITRGLPISQYGENTIELRARYFRNGSTLTASLFDTVVNKINTLPYFNGFESEFVACYQPSISLNLPRIDERNGWSVDPDFINDWTIIDTADCVPIGNTATYDSLSGPAVPGDSSAFAAWHNASLGNSDLYSPCFDLNAYSSLRLEFLYHRYINKVLSSQTYGSFSLEARNGTQWVEIFRNDTVITGSNIPAWKKASVDISAFNGTDVQFRFVNRQAFAETDIVFTSIDAFNIFETLPTNIESLDTHTQTIAVYPNPSHGQFTIEVPEELIGERYEIIDISGKLLISRTFRRSSEPIQIEADKGVYILSVPTRGIYQKVVVY